MEVAIIFVALIVYASIGGYVTSKYDPSFKLDPIGMGLLWPLTLYKVLR